jgi:RecA-family ATPase
MTKAQRIAEEREREAAQHRAEREAEIREREVVRERVEAEREADVEKRLEKLRIDHEAKKRLVSEITRQRQFELPESGWTADEFLAENEEPPEAVVKGLHYRGNNTLLVAQYKTGKTTLEINLARSLVDGVPFLGQFDTYMPYGKVAFFNYEMDKKQFRYWLNQTEIENTDRILPLNLRGYRLAFWDEGEMNRLAEYLLSEEVGFIIMDPASKAWRGLIDNEGDNVQLSEFFGAIDELKRLADVSNLLLAVHTPREEGSNRARGGGEIEAWPDGNWYLGKARGSQTRVLRAEGRDIELDETALSYVSETRALLAVGTTEDRKFEEGVESAKNVLEAARHFDSTKEYADAMQGKTGEKRKWIKECVKRGHAIERKNGQHKSYDWSQQNGS